MNTPRFTATRLENGAVKIMDETRKQMNKPIITQRECDTILAALRYWQTHVLYSETLQSTSDLTDIAEEHGPMLDAGEVDDLCFRLNS